MFKDKEEFGINLQLFAEGGAEDGKGESGTHTDDDEGKEKTFTQEELDNILQDRLTREKNKYEKDLRDKIEKEKEEAKRLADLSAEERTKELAAKQEQELAELKEELKRRDLEADTISVLEQEGLSTKFKDFLIGIDAESTNENIKAFKEEFNAAVKEGVEDKLKGKTPTINTNNSLEVKNPWAEGSINLTEQGRILREDPELARRLMNLTK